jgi:hypothetical protein
MRKRREPLRIPPVKLLDRPAEFRGFAANFVQRDDPVENVERGVLHPLRGDGAGALLELQHELRAQRLVHGMRIVRRRQQHGAEKVEEGVLHGRIAPARTADRAADQLLLQFTRWLARQEVGAIDREACDDLAHRGAERIHGEVAVPAIALGDAIQQMAEHRDLARERRLHDEPFAAIRHIVIVHQRPDEARMAFGDFLLRAPIHEDADHVVCELVARGPVDGPIGAKRFAWPENLLHQQV